MSLHGCLEHDLGNETGVHMKWHLALLKVSAW